MKATIFISRGNEKEISKSLRMTALEKTLKSSAFSLHTDERGKPHVTFYKPVGISISHSEAVVAVGVFPFEPVGLDMEKQKNTYPESVPRRFFSKGERKLIESPKDFYKIWCCKEAYVKMTGEGIAGISSFDSTSSDVNFLDLSKQVSSLLGEDFCLIVASREEISDIDIEIITVR
jgi:phosphopantetheinyl transferase